MFISWPRRAAAALILASSSSAGISASMRTFVSLSSVTVVFIGRTTIEVSTRGRLAAWLVTGPLGRLAAFVLDLFTLFVWTLDYWLRRLLRLGPP
jgi:hypothetical protein